jgi:hypothetical protein
MAGPGLRIEASPSEAARFGLSMARVSVGVDVPLSGAEYSRVQAELAEAIARLDEDLLIVRYPAGAMALGAVVGSAGRRVIPAGALTYWGASAEDIPEDSTGTLDVVSAHELSMSGTSHGAITQMLNDVVADSFAGYGNHYLANPLIDADAALAGYQEWARRSLANHGRDVLILRHGSEPLGVATMAQSLDGSSHLEVLLAGLVSAAQGRGRYATLLAACAREARVRDVARLIISTQAHNVRVQRAWARAGLRPFAAIETVHAISRALSTTLSMSRGQKGEVTFSREA